MMVLLNAKCRVRKAAMARGALSAGVPCVVYAWQRTRRARVGTGVPKGKAIRRTTRSGRNGQ